MTEDAAFDEDSHVTDTVGPDYDEIDRRVFGMDDERETVQNLLEGVRLMFHWIRQGDNDRARSVRLQAVTWYARYSTKNQEALGREIGVTKAAINQQVSALRDFIRAQAGHDVKARGARSTEAREKFSQICKSSHEKRKSELRNSPPKSTPSSMRLFDLKPKLNPFPTPLLS